MSPQLSQFVLSWPRLSGLGVNVIATAPEKNNIKISVNPRGCSNVSDDGCACRGHCRAREFNITAVLNSTIVVDGKNRSCLSRLLDNQDVSIHGQTFDASIVDLQKGWNWSDPSTRRSKLPDLKALPQSISDCTTFFNKSNFEVLFHAIKTRFINILFRFSVKTHAHLW